MKKSILSDNQARRLDMPLWMLICFSMFNVWQMGFIYFLGPSLVIDGRTPVPISMDNVTALIAVSYVLSIIFMVVFPRKVVWAERISITLALICTGALFAPLSPEMYKTLIYTITFSCCFMIGFETFIISGMFSGKSVIRHLTLAYGVALVIIALVQNDVYPVSFSVFRILSLLMIIMMTVFFYRLPASAENYPVFVKKKDGITIPKKLFIGLFTVGFVSCIMMLAGPAAVASVKNGVTIAYMSDALASLAVYILLRKAKVHPVYSISAFISLSVVGFLMLFLSQFVPSLAYPAAVLIGFGFMPCQLCPLYGFVMIRRYPSKYIAPGIIMIALITVLIHSSLVEAFRSAPNMLNLAYMAITVVLMAVYMQVIPYLTYSLSDVKKAGIKSEKYADIPAEMPEKSETEQSEKNLQPGIRTVHETESAFERKVDQENILSALTSREREVLDLIGIGYSNKDIAKILVISEHTVNDYTKKIYRKLGVHSRYSAAQILNKIK